MRHDTTLMVVEDTRYWDGSSTTPYEREIRYVELVKRVLNLGDTKLCRPPVKQQKEDLVLGWVPARRFPDWTHCNRCGLLHNRPWYLRSDGDPAATVDADVGQTGARPRVFKCQASSQGSANGTQRCDGTLEQVPWVLVHECGHLADVPWHAIAHHKARNPEQTACLPEWDRPYLKLKNVQGRMMVRCGTCGAESRLPERFPFGTNTWQQPWVRRPPSEPPRDSQPGWLVGVNDVRVHFAECRTALVIPPESRIRRGSVVDRLYNNSAGRQRINAARNPSSRDSRIRDLARRYRCRPRPAEIEAALAAIDNGYPFHREDLPHGRLAQLEYAKLIEPIPDLRPDEDFVTEHRSWPDLGGDLGRGPLGIAKAVNRLVAVHRVKEIMVFDGFRRGWGSGDGMHPMTPPDIVGESDWLPALELWGEGLFFTLDEGLVKRWEQQESIRARAEGFLDRALTARLPRNVEAVPSPRFLLCHTLAHLIIRRLEAEAGYPAASIKERIYCVDSEEGSNAMAGVLIYVAVADEHGSLGGLIDMAQPDRFMRLLTGAVEDATWCSFDPVCAEQDGHGPDLLNRAACHACALVPEPSCICGNRLLDRMFVKGDGDVFQSLWDMAVSGERRRPIVV